LTSVRLRAPARLQTAGFLAAKAVGYDAEVMREKHDYWLDFHRRIAATKTIGIHFDEVQDAFINTNINTSKTLVQMFKGLMTNESHPLVLVLTGTLDLKPYFETEDEQGPRRFKFVTLPSLSYPADAGRTKSNVDLYCNQAGLENRLKGTDYERLMRAGAYQFGRTFTRVLDGIEEALLAGATGLERLHLAHAYDRDRNVPPSRNMFVAEDYLLLKSHSQSEDPSTDPTKRKSKPRSKTKW
jgi:hypothetical protein